MQKRPFRNVNEWLHVSTVVEDDCGHGLSKESVLPEAPPVRDDAHNSNSYTR